LQRLASRKLIFLGRTAGKASFAAFMSLVDASAAENDKRKDGISAAALMSKSKND
jgi:hypothetical protein